MGVFSQFGPLAPGFWSLCTFSTWNICICEALHFHLIVGQESAEAGSMPGHSEATVYIGNLDDRVDERLLYEIMVQAGPLVEVYIPRDKETSRHKGYAFAEFTSEKSAQYALSLFSGLLSLYKRPVRLAISGSDRPAAPAQAQ